VRLLLDENVPVQAFRFCGALFEDIV